MNSIHARADFSFKGESYELETVIDLDACPCGAGDAPNFHLILAKAAGIDPYSYLYEVLESHEIEFFAATGVAAKSCHEGQFDWATFERDAGEERDLQKLRGIARERMGVADLEQHPALRAALLAAYRMGKGEGAAA